MYPLHDGIVGGFYSLVFSSLFLYIFYRENKHIVEINQILIAMAVCLYTVFFSLYLPAFHCQYPN